MRRTKRLLVITLTAAGGLHVESEGYAASVTRSHTGFTQRAFGGGIKGEGKFFFFGAGVAWGFDVMAQHQVDVNVVDADQDQESVGLDVTVTGEPWLRRWDPDKQGNYGAKGAYVDGLAPGRLALTLIVG